jgi:hypothetical protein
MAAPVAILAKPDDHRGILKMSEAVDAMLEAFRNWAKDPLVAEITGTQKVTCPMLRMRRSSIEGKLKNTRFGDQSWLNKQRSRNTTIATLSVPTSCHFERICPWVPQLRTVN